MRPLSEGRCLTAMLAATDDNRHAIAVLLPHQPDSATGASRFQPGSGTLPPHLAGRGSEQALIRGSSEVLARRAAPAGDIVIYGPEGRARLRCYSGPYARPRRWASMYCDAPGR